MTREFLEGFAKDQIGKEVDFSDFSYELQKIGFEDLYDSYDENTLRDVLKSGICYYSFVENIGINEENEDLDGLKVRMEFKVLTWSGEDEVINADIKITECAIEN
ncbi:hypothetical protein [Clostridium perfringens]|uniref:hypothetical protein n=1 Tax=Clostridium perfringens TaxID=1502 RepID=UPI0023413AF3|nr:hypothetical protein [Clostridium perfringens]MDC4245563.1 hypothetical protein [Clostridium perfringens]